jgi:uncharacterized protein (DUF2252 family)
MCAASNSVLEEILEYNRDRKKDLLKIKFARMSENAFAFFRGTDHLFATRWPAFRPHDAGPSLLICGDLHLENFGAYQTDDGDFRYDINDFDEALVAACGLDIVRCTTSTLLAAESWGIPPVAASCIALDFLTSYRQAVRDAVATGTCGEITPDKGDGPIWELLEKTALGSQEKLLDRHTERTKHGERRIIRGDGKHPDISPKKAALIRQAVEEYGATQPNPAAYRVLDVTGRVMGIGSLGLRHYTVLIAGGGTPDSNRFADIKQAAPSALRSCASGPQPDTGGNEALRVVAAQRQLQSKPALGLTAIDIDGLHYRMRQLVPDENRSKLDRLQKKPDKLRSAVKVIGQLAAWSQIRGTRAQHAESQQALATWAEGPALDTLLTSAVKCADITCADYKSFVEAYNERLLEQ